MTTVELEGTQIERVRQILETRFDPIATAKLAGIPLVSSSELKLFLIRCVLEFRPVYLATSSHEDSGQASLFPT